jgi:hypothetical protein
VRNLAAVDEERPVSVPLELLVRHRYSSNWIEKA